MHSVISMVSSVKREGERRGKERKKNPAIGFFSVESCTNIFKVHELRALLEKKGGGMGELHDERAKSRLALTPL